MFVEVAVPLYVHKTFIYRLPQSIAETVKPGCRVRVSFGKQNIVGYVVHVHERPEDAGIDINEKKLKNVEELLETEPLVTEEMLELSRWVSDYYYAPWGEVLRSCLPAGINKDQVKPKRQNVVALIDQTLNIDDTLFNEQQGKILKLLMESQPLPVAYSQLADEARVSPSVIKTLEKKGYVRIYSREVRRDPLAYLKLRSHNENVDFVLNEKQQEALDRIKQKLDIGEYAGFLLHGITGSGKTEVYMRAMRLALDHGKTALMLVPEIALTPMFAKRLREHFGDAVAILHSSLSGGERLDEWNRIRSGDAKIVIGARSGVFAPLQNLGLIVVDEEHESSYKQEDSPRYHARDTAIMRALKAKAVVILGSATPSMETFHNAHTGKYEYIKLSERFGGRNLANVEIVDMRKVFDRHGKQQIFSDEMKTAIVDNWKQGKQTLVLLNRRGFSAFVLCRSCGYRARCVNCDVSLTFHKSEAKLICHYCNHQERVPKFCPQCNGQFIYYMGEGTEQIEALFKGLYPDMRIARLDRDTTRRKGAFEKILNEFESGDLDLLVGTQMIAKGHDFPNVTLVCVISVDAGLGMPDFRSAERTFQLLTQVAGRAGRGDEAGKVIIQSYHTEHYALEYAREQNYDKFYNHEIHYRKNLTYPPFIALINILIKHDDYAKAATVAADLVRLLKDADSEKVLRVLGPAPAPMARLKGEHRLQILIKTKHRRQAREALDAAMNEMKLKGPHLKMISVEVDPVNMM